MKNLTCASVLLMASALLSCSEDADTVVPVVSPTAENEVAYSNTRYLLENGLLEDFGATDSDNHYNVDFAVSDGLFLPVLTSIGDFLTTFWIVSEGTIEVVAQLYSPGSDAFRSGTFAFTSLPEDEVDNGEYFVDE